MKVKEKKMLWVPLLDLEENIPFGWSDYVKFSLCENVGYIFLFSLDRLKRQTKHRNTQTTQKKNASGELKLSAYQLDLEHCDLIMPRPNPPTLPLVLARRGLGLQQAPSHQPPWTGWNQFPSCVHSAQVNLLRASILLLTWSQLTFLIDASSRP